MTDTYTFSDACAPLLVSVPHDGRLIPDALSARMSGSALGIPDTDWHVAELYDFAADLGAAVLVARYSRYVIDLNRAADDAPLYDGKPATGLCPDTTFAGEPVYTDGRTVSAAERQQRIDTHWQPYHQKIRTTLDALKTRFGYALLWDAHSIPSRVPRLFDGELPVLNLGTYDGRSCAGDIVKPVYRVATDSGFDAVLDQRFKGGHITREYGDPENNVHALQLEIAQRAYMDERTTTFDREKARVLRSTLRPMLVAFLQSAQRYYS